MSNSESQEQPPNAPSGSYYGHRVGQPIGEMPARLPVDLVLWRTADHAAWISAIRVFSTGCWIELVSQMREHRHDWGLHKVQLSVRWTGQEDAMTWAPYGGGPPSDGPRLFGGGGCGSPGTSLSSFWLPTLPRLGTLVFAAEWPQEGIGAHVVEVSAPDIFGTASRARQIWADQRSAGQE
jgi:hypothetical protein